MKGVLTQGMLEGMQHGTNKSCAMPLLGMLHLSVVPFVVGHRKRMLSQHLKERKSQSIRVE